MKLVIDAAHVGQVLMQVGRVELPLTREQVVQMLFGDDYEIVRATDRSARPTGAPRVKRAAAAPPPSGSASKRRARTPSAMVLEIILQALTRKSPLGSDALRAALEQHAPGLLASKDAGFLVKRLSCWTKEKKLVRFGLKPHFLYRMPASATTAAPPKVRGSGRKASPKTQRAAPDGEPSFVDQVITVLAAQSAPATSVDLKQRLDAKYPDSMSGRNSSVVSAALYSLVRQSLVTRTGTAGGYHYAMAKNWEKTRAKRSAVHHAESGARLAVLKVTKGKAAKGKQLPLVHLNGASGASAAGILAAAEAAS